MSVVLIEPLWNWNTNFFGLASSLKCINRTFMELKPNAFGMEKENAFSINRTFMELKLV